MGPDIGPILDQWPYESGQVTVRKIRGADGREKLQLRLDLGLLQMEVQGRPDGRRPHDCDSVLKHVERRLADYRLAHGADVGFDLDEPIQAELRDEALMNYHRYLSLYVLEDFDGVVRDTSANLRIFDLVKAYSPAPADRASLEQYRPYVVMMNTRARAQRALGRGDPRHAMAVVNSGLAAIRHFLRENGRGDLFRHASEVTILRDLRREIAPKLPRDPVRVLKRRLNRAVQAERYEEAARLRDRIESLLAQQVPTQPPPALSGDHPS